MLEKKYYDGFQIRRILDEVLNDSETVLRILQKFAKEPSAQLPAQCVANVTIDGEQLKELVDRTIKEITMDLPGYWNPIIVREMTKEEEEEHPDWCRMYENTPPLEEEVLISDGKYVWSTHLLHPPKILLELSYRTEQLSFALTLF